MKFRFTVEDFEPHPEASELADRSNVILDEHLATLSVVYARVYPDETIGGWKECGQPSNFNTHRAYLFDVEGIEK